VDELERRVKRGNRAIELLNDPLMSEAREHIDQELWRLFKASAPTDTEALSQIKAMEYMHGKYLGFLKLCIQDGKMATMDIERRKKTLRERFLG
jgi:hypothetical protein